MYCKYYKQVPSLDYFPKCNIDGNICPFVYRCYTNNVWKPLASMNGCTNCTRQERIETMKKGHSLVKMIKKGMLYIDVAEIDMTIKIENPFDYEPTSVELVKINGEYYIKGYEPKRQIKKKIEEDK